LTALDARGHSDHMPSIRSTSGRLLLALTLASVLVSCQPGSSAPEKTPPCGGFHLRVINQTAGRINIDVNDTPAAILEPSDSKILAQYLPPQLPDMPWTVVITRSTDASKIGDARFVGGPDRDLFVSANGLDEKPLAPPTPAC
jgi:hypothetical protein